MSEATRTNAILAMGESDCEPTRADLDICVDAYAEVKLKHELLRIALRLLTRLSARDMQDTVNLMRTRLAQTPAEGR